MNDPARVNVLIVDDHPVTRTGLALFCEAFPDLRLVGQVGSGVEALESCEQCQPDVILLDMKLPDIDGVTVTAAIRQKHPHVQVIAISSSDDSALMERAVRAGAALYLIKTGGAQDLICAIRSAHAGRSGLSPALHSPNGRAS